MDLIMVPQVISSFEATMDLFVLGVVAFASLHSSHC